MRGTDARRLPLAAWEAEMGFASPMHSVQASLRLGDLKMTTYSGIAARADSMAGAILFPSKLLLACQAFLAGEANHARSRHLHHDWRAQSQLDFWRPRPRFLKGVGRLPAQIPDAQASAVEHGAAAWMIDCWLAAACAKAGSPCQGLLADAEAALAEPDAASWMDHHHLSASEVCVQATFPGELPHAESQSCDAV